MDLGARSVCPQWWAFLARCPQVSVLLLMAGFPFSPDMCGWYFELCFLMVMTQLFIGMLATCVHSEEKYLSGPLSTFLNKRSFSYWLVSSSCGLEMKPLPHGLQAPFLVLPAYLCPFTFAPFPLPPSLCPSSALLSYSAFFYQSVLFCLTGLHFYFFVSFLLLMFLAFFFLKKSLPRPVCWPLSYVLGLW